MLSGAAVAGRLVQAEYFPDSPPRFRTAIRLTALGGQVAFTFSVAIAPADIGSQFASYDRRELWFSVVGERLACSPGASWVGSSGRWDVEVACGLADELFAARSPYTAIWASATPSSTLRLELAFTCIDDDNALAKLPAGPAGPGKGRGTG